MLSIAPVEQPAILQHVMPTDSQNEHADAKLTKQQRLAIRIANEITAFEKHLRNEVHTHQKQLSSAKFQAHLTNEQNAFAARIAKQGGTYTPIPLDELLVGTSAPSAPTVTATVASASDITLN